MLRGTKGHSKTRGLYFFFRNNTLKIILQHTKIDAMGIEIFMIRKNTFYALCVWLLLVRINNSLKTISVRKFNNC
jgi:septum formation topological specificity factor MinE